MGTRSLTVFKNNDGSEIAVLYRQYDGYPSSHGKTVADLLKDKTLTNGISGDATKVCNGMSCLAVQVITHLKHEEGNAVGAGGFYLHAAGKRDCGEEYIYTLYPKDGVICMRVQSGRVTAFGNSGDTQDKMDSIFDGPVKKFTVAACEKAEA